MASSLAEQLREKGYLTAHQLVSFLRSEKSVYACSYPTLMRRINENKVPTIKVGGQYRVTYDTIMEEFKYQLPELPGLEES